MKTAPISVDYLGHYGSDLVVANAARVSFHKTSDWEWGRMLSEKDAKLINYLAKHKHYSPFNHAFLSLRVKAPLFVARQLQKHEYLPWNEVSRRYVSEEPEFYYPGWKQWRLKADNVKQGSSEETTEEPSVVLSEQQDSWYESDKFDFEDMCGVALIYYNSMLEKGIAPEQARMILPQNMMTTWIWSGTLKAFAKMLELRLDPHAQSESRDVAKLILPIVEEHFPISIKALLNND